MMAEIPSRSPESYPPSPEAKEGIERRRVYSSVLSGEVFFKEDGEIKSETLADKVTEGNLIVDRDAGLIRFGEEPSDEAYEALAGLKMLSLEGAQALVGEIDIKDGAILKVLKDPTTHSSYAIFKSSGPNFSSEGVGGYLRYNETDEKGNRVKIFELDHGGTVDISGGESALRYEFKLEGATEHLETVAEVNAHIVALEAEKKRLLAQKNEREQRQEEPFTPPIPEPFVPSQESPEERRLRQEAADREWELQRERDRSLAEKREHHEDLVEALNNARERFARMTADKMDRATGLLWTDKKEAAYREAEEAYDTLYKRVAATGIAYLDSKGEVAPYQHTELATLYVVEEQRKLRQRTEEVRLEALDSSKLKQWIAESRLGRLASGVALGMGTRGVLGLATGGVGWGTGIAAGAISGGVLGAFGGKRRGIRESARESMQGLGTELEELQGRITPGQDVDTILGIDKKREQAIERSRKRVARRMRRGLAQGAMYGAFGAAVGQGAAELFWGGDTASGTSNGEIGGSDAGEATGPEVKTHELSSSELLERYAGDTAAEARDIQLGEGPYRLFEDMGIPESEWEDLYRNENLMNQLIENGDAYSLEATGEQGYGWGIAHAGEMSNASIVDIYQAAGMETSVTEVVGADGHITEVDPGLAEGNNFDISPRAIESAQRLGEGLADIDSRYNSVDINANRLPEVVEIIQTNPTFMQQFDIISKDVGLVLRGEPDPQVVQQLMNQLSANGLVTTS